MSDLGLERGQRKRFLSAQGSSWATRGENDSSGVCKKAVAPHHFIRGNTCGIHLHTVKSAEVHVRLHF